MVDVKFPNACSEFIYVRTYSRWIDDKKRRETWPETVERYVLDNTNVKRCLLTINNDKIWMYYDGYEDPSIVKEKVEEWYIESPINVRKVDKIQVNKMNKLNRTAT